MLLIKDHMRLYFCWPISFFNIINWSSKRRIWGDEFYFINNQIIISVRLFKRPFLFCIRPNFFKIINSFICKPVLGHTYNCFAWSDFKWFFTLKSCAIPLFSPSSRADFIASSFLSSCSSNLNPARMTSLAEWYLPDTTFFEIKLSKWSPNDIDVFLLIIIDFLQKYQILVLKASFF